MTQSRCQKQEDLTENTGHRFRIKPDNVKIDTGEHLLKEDKDGLNSVSEILTLDHQAEKSLLPMDPFESSDKLGKQKENLIKENCGFKDISFKDWLAQTYVTFQEERSTENGFFLSATKGISAYLSKQLAMVRNRAPLEMYMEYVRNVIVFVNAYLPKYEGWAYLFLGVYLVCYGGSYPFLAVALAGCEISGMKQTLCEGYRLGKILAEDSQNTEIAAGEIKNVIKEISLQFSWFFAIWSFPIWGEFCVLAVLILRLSLTFPVVRMLKDSTFMWKISNPEKDPMIESNWLPLVGVSFVALTFLIFFPCLVTGLYLGHIGICHIIPADFDEEMTKANVQDFSSTKQVILKNKSAIRSYVWGFLVLMSLSQASRIASDTFFSFWSMVSVLANAQTACCH